MRTSFYLLFSFITLMFSCKQESNSNINDISPNDILQASIKEHGGDQFKKSNINLEFSSIKYSLKYDAYGRADFEQTREINAKKHRITYKHGLISYFISDTLRPQEEYSQKMAEMSLYGFLYTFSIPFNLTTNDVKISKLPNVTIRNKEYYTLDIQYTKLPDIPEDRILLYINANSSRIEYMALKHDLSGPKAQFRRMINPRNIEGILFQDYIQFHSKNATIALDEMYGKFNDGDLKLIRTVTFDSIAVTPK